MQLHFPACICTSRHAFALPGMHLHLPACICSSRHAFVLPGMHLFVPACLCIPSCICMPFADYSIINVTVPGNQLHGIWLLQESDVATNQRVRSADVEGWPTTHSAGSRLVSLMSCSLWPQSGVQTSICLSVCCLLSYSTVTPISQTPVRHCSLVVSAPAWDGTGCEFDSWQCRIYIPCSLSLRLLGSPWGSLGTYGLTQKLY